MDVDGREEKAVPAWKELSAVYSKIEIGLV